jgi:hypothetical protein
MNKKKHTQLTKEEQVAEQRQPHRPGGFAQRNICAHAGLGPLLWCVCIRDGWMGEILSGWMKECMKNKRNEYACYLGREIRSVNTQVHKKNCTNQGGGLS